MRSIRIMSLARHAGLAFCIGLVAACGGGGGGGGEGPASGGAMGPETPPTPVIAGVGGPPGDPGVFIFYSWNEFNSSNGYYKYEGAIGERLIFRVNLASPLTALEASRCSANPGTGSTPSAYATQIHVYDTNFNRVTGACSEDFTYTFTEPGERIFQFDYPMNGPGTFFVASLVGDEPISFDPYGGGTPTEPKMLQTNSLNEFMNIPFMNYFWVSATKGQKLVIDTTLSEPLTAQERARCSANPNSHNTRIFIYDAQMNQIEVHCGEDLIFDVPESGIYVLQFHFGNARAGGFEAAII